ncbi:hypothetical protein LXA43DRAFT_316447 [Ganoderma leucocontextum]|nr:hypothetical protein LXA43DRAFT_316447 [Ganoderma leucocontextum]
MFLGRASTPSQTCPHLLWSYTRPPFCLSLRAIQSHCIPRPYGRHILHPYASTLPPQLSLRDHPRVYHQYTRGRPVGDGPKRQPWHTPILLDCEILSILRRMELPLLRSLEIVYEITEEDSDSELLSYIVGTFPHLEHLEVHRYRGERNMSTRHKSIAEILARAQSLRTVRLNLDFHDDPQAYCGINDLRYEWLQTLRTDRAPEIVEIMQACPFLEHVAILYHGLPSSVWVEFHPSRCAEPRFVMSYSDAYVDSEMIGRRWYPPLDHASERR